MVVVVGGRVMVSVGCRVWEDCRFAGIEVAVVAAVRGAVVAGETPAPAAADGISEGVVAVVDIPAAEEAVVVVTEAPGVLEEEHSAGLTMAATAD